MRGVPLTLLLILLVTPVYGLYHPSEPEVRRGEITLELSPMSPMAGEPIEMAIKIVSKDTGNLVPHIDYRVVVSRDGVELFRREFHDHEGDLILRFIPSDGDMVRPMSGGFEVYGDIFSMPGEYKVEVSVIGIEFNPIDPFSKTFTIEVMGDAVDEMDDMEKMDVEGEMNGMAMDMNTVLLVSVVAVAIVLAAAALILRRGG